MSKKRTTVRRFEDDGHDEEIETQTTAKNEVETGQDSQLSNILQNDPNKSSGSKLWSYVSSFLRFASFTPPTDLSMPEIKTSDNESHVIIKRCASFTGRTIFVTYFKILIC